MKTTIFKINDADFKAIYSYLLKREKDFTPQLVEKLDIFQYAKKIYENGNVYTAHAKDIVGLIACYANNYNTLEAYITNISIQPSYYGTGLAEKLINYCLEDVSGKGFKTIKLEVHKENRRAINFYKKIGFKFFDDEFKQESYYMIKNVCGK